MKTTFIIVCAGLFFASGELYAQSKDSNEVKKSFSEIFKINPLQFDSLEASLNTVGAKAYLLARDMQRRKGDRENMSYIDPNMPVLILPKNHQGSLRIIELPKDYPSRMPIKKLEESQSSAVILPQKK